MHLTARAAGARPALCWSRWRLGGLPDQTLGSVSMQSTRDPSSIEFCHNVGLDYVSCSPFRVPIARLAAAQAAIKARKK